MMSERFGIKTYRVLITYMSDSVEGGLAQVEFTGIRATSVPRAKEQARTEFVNMLTLPEDRITQVFAILTL